MKKQGFLLDFCHKWHFDYKGPGALGRGGVEDTRLEAKAAVKDTKKKSEAKAKDLGHSRKCSPKKGLQKSVSGNLQFIGVARIFAWGGLNHKTHAMMSSKICLLALNQDFAEGEGLN